MRCYLVFFSTQINLFAKLNEQKKTRFNLAVARKGAQKRIKTRTMLLDNIHYIKVCKDLYKQKK